MPKISCSSPLFSTEYLPVAALFSVLVHPWPRPLALRLDEPLLSRARASVSPSSGQRPIWPPIFCATVQYSAVQYRHTPSDISLNHWRLHSTFQTKLQTESYSSLWVAMSQGIIKDLKQEKLEKSISSWI